MEKEGVVNMAIYNGVVPFVCRMLNAGTVVGNFVRCIMIMYFVETTYLIIVVSTTNVGERFINDVRDRFLVSDVYVRTYEDCFPNFFRFVDFKILLM